MSHVVIHVSLLKNLRTGYYLYAYFIDKEMYTEKLLSSVQGHLLMSSGAEIEIQAVSLSTNMTLDCMMFIALTRKLNAQESLCDLPQTYSVKEEIRTKNLIARACLMIFPEPKRISWTNILLAYRNFLNKLSEKSDTY